MKLRITPTNLVVLSLGFAGCDFFADFKDDGATSVGAAGGNSGGQSALAGGASAAGGIQIGGTSSGVGGAPNSTVVSGGYAASMGGASTAPASGGGPLGGTSGIGAWGGASGGQTPAGGGSLVLAGGAAQGGSIAVNGGAPQGGRITSGGAAAQGGTGGSSLGTGGAVPKGGAFSGGATAKGGASSGGVLNGGATAKGGSQSGGAASGGAASGGAASGGAASGGACNTASACGPSCTACGSGQQCSGGSCVCPGGAAFVCNACLSWDFESGSISNWALTSNNATGTLQLAALTGQGNYSLSIANAQFNAGASSLGVQIPLCNGAGVAIPATGFAFSVSVRFQSNSGLDFGDDGSGTGYPAVLLEANGFSHMVAPDNAPFSNSIWYTWPFSLVGTSTTTIAIRFAPQAPWYGTIYIDSISLK